MKKEYASSEERAVDILYKRLGKMILIKDKDGKPKEWKTTYPPIADLIANCNKEKVKLPKSPKLHDVLLAMVKAGYNGVQRYPSPDQAIKSLSDRVFEKEQKDLGFPVTQEKAEVNTKEAEQAQREADKEATQEKE